ncbi:deoxyguanosinetriphosphate triphosphohydrolase [Helicobacter sp. 16-1353]|uniref:deoxyguanosinetriphosphate triphosphohydrolase family protein n=1 Tax=Helicobacter sp. 16-1353 TaxID=2004996 RepID=UPI000DCD4DA4|nr:dNTP triphosphohydrolase [Helicobacter sp. 16-1353]RAX53165.1 deoxyguanosinetriphosphate triphosphohydrolase [Helicobacter sp. 16-1353]
MKYTDRFYPFKEDFRNPYARDRDRIIHCSSFRRLEYKTQVFLNTQGDYFRTRLTHTIEVSQIARVIANHCGLEENLAEAIALSHDLGHSPFGHAGGDELDFVLKKYGFKNGFEHNFQSFRVVTELEKRYKDFSGLNLTFATLEGILKHSKPYEKPFFSSNLKQIFDIKKEPRLEAVIVDLSDEIAYCSHDIDDGIKQKLINFEILSKNKIVRDITENIQRHGISPSDKIFRYRFISSLINLLIENIINNFKQTKQIRYDANLAENLASLKKILFKNLYRHEEVQRKMFFGRLCIRSLFSDFMDNPSLLPKDSQNKIDNGYKKHRVVSDYIASMTDRYAIKCYKELHIGE